MLKECKWRANTHTCLLVFESGEYLSASVPVGPREQHAQDRGHAVRGHDHVLQGFVLDHTQEQLQAQIRASFSVRRGLRRRDTQRTNRQQHTQVQWDQHREGHTGSSPGEDTDRRDEKVKLYFYYFYNDVFRWFRTLRCLWITNTSSARKMKLNGRQKR